jgi:hypothetical protein
LSEASEGGGVLAVDEDNNGANLLEWKDDYEEEESGGVLEVLERRGFLTKYNMMGVEGEEEEVAPAGKSGQRQTGMFANQYSCTATYVSWRFFSY